jgi:3-hydroxyisobutyrate dehydrogenase-like beta-hydroxyacid dehydrogenase
MGGPIFTNLVQYAGSNHLPAPCAWNIVKTRYDELRPDCEGAVFCEDLEEVVGRSNVVFTCLLNDPVAEEVYERLFAAAREHKGKDKVVFVDQSSLKPKTSSEWRRIAQTRGAKVRQGSSKPQRTESGLRISQRQSSVVPMRRKLLLWCKY